MSEIKMLTNLFVKFRDDRDWAQFHKPKDIALSLMLESAELLELFQWKNDEQVAQYFEKYPEKFKDELADIFGWVLILAHDLKIDLRQATREKIAKNEAKYPVEKARGHAKKYTEL